MKTAKMTIFISYDEKFFSYKKALENDKRILERRIDSHKFNMNDKEKKVYLASYFDTFKIKNIKKIHNKIRELEREINLKKQSKVFSFYEEAFSFLTSDKDCLNEFNIFRYKETFFQNRNGVFIEDKKEVIQAKKYSFFNYINLKLRQKYLKEQNRRLSFPNTVIHFTEEYINTFYQKEPLSSIISNIDILKLALKDKKKEVEKIINIKDYLKLKNKLDKVNTKLEYIKEKEEAADIIPF